MDKIGVCGSHRTIGHLAGQIDFVEEHVQRLLVPLADQTAFQESAAGITETSIPVSAANSFLPGDLRSTGPEMSVDRVVAYAETAFRRAAEVGIRIIVYGSGGSRQIPEGFSRARAEEQFVEILGALGPLAGRHGILLVVEPLASGDCNFINSLAEGAKAVRACNHESVALLADFYHMARDDEAPDQIAVYGDLIRHVHAAELENRAAPGTRGDDFRPYLRALRKAGYGGAISLECRWTDPVSEAVSGVAALRAQISEI
jgi:sugar phosphate isomerase/epimerase